MPLTIEQTARFPALPEHLYRLYMNPRLHAAATGWAERVTISPRPGSRFRIGRALAGRTLLAVPGRLVVQTWRGTDWKKTERDSVLILAFERAPRGGRVRMVHANVPDRHRSVRSGWPTYYWRPWKKYLRARG